MFLIGVILGIRIGILLIGIQFLLGKSEAWDKNSSSSFECGFRSYFNSRFSFSIHYFLIGLVFLFLDLELCIIIPFFNEGINNLVIILVLTFFIFILLIGLIHEWSTSKLDWLD